MRTRAATAVAKNVAPPGSKSSWAVLAASRAAGRDSDRLAQASALVERLARYRFRSQGHLRNAVLKQVLVEDWFPRGESTGEATRVICRIASNANLAIVARNSGINRFLGITRSRGQELSGSTLARTMEDIIGAVYLDSGKSMMMARNAVHGFGLVPTTVDNSAGGVTPSTEPPSDGLERAIPMSVSPLSLAGKGSHDGLERAISPSGPRMAPVDVHVSVTTSDVNKPITVDVSVQFL
ncbi:hypothetical protein LTR97_005136 [Elasticomyces elasticus]|uniref:RNase III domain-containing protein n=1 Tax=Elasticomyces elasticus TaxID=574655 RepID=A0AAN7ZNR5_9PEZI|nr:hypothetical protein LTR97_005136 [Elasticomyces elasticus]